MTDETLLDDGTVVSNENVEVSRRLVRKGGGIIGVVEIRPTDRKPVAMVHVVDHFPDDLPIEDVGFNAEAEPEAGDITPRRASIKQTVEDKPVEVHYGIKLSGPVGSVEFGSPEIRAVETAELTRSGTSLTDGGKRSSASADGVEDSSGSLSSIVSILGRGASGAEREDDRRPSDPGEDRASLVPSRTEEWDAGSESDAADPDEGAPDGSQASNEAIESAVARVDESEDAETGTADTADEDGTDGGNTPSDSNAPEEPIESAVARIDAPGDTEAGPGTETAPTEESSGEPDGSGSETADTDAAEADPDETGADAIEITTGADADGEAGVGADVGAADGPSPEPSPVAESGLGSASGGEGTRDDPDDESAPSERRSVEARLDRLTLRVEEFAAYATALEGLIDEHGPAEEFIYRTESELAELDERLRSVGKELESIRDDHGEGLDDLRERTDALDRRIGDTRDALERDVGDVRDRVDEEVERIDEEVGRVDADVEALDDRVAEVESDVRSVRESVRSVEQEVSSVSEDVRAVREELESLGEAVESFDDVRRTLAEAFDLTAEAEPPADD